MAVTTTPAQHQLVPNPLVQNTLRSALPLQLLDVSRCPNIAGDALDLHPRCVLQTLRAAGCNGLRSVVIQLPTEAPLRSLNLESCRQLHEVRMLRCGSGQLGATCAACCCGPENDVGHGWGWKACNGCAVAVTAACMRSSWPAGPLRGTAPCPTVSKCQSRLCPCKRRWCWWLTSWSRPVSRTAANCAPSRSDAGALLLGGVFGWRVLRWHSGLHAARNHRLLRRRLSSAHCV